MEINLLLILLLININFIQSFKCGADQIKLNPKSITFSSSKKTQNLSKANAESETPLVIGYDFSTLQRPSSMTTTTYNNIKSALIGVTEEFSKFLKISHRQISLKGMKNTIMDYCGLSVIGADYENFLIKNDIIIFPQFDSSLDSSVIAAAGACIIEKNSNHPYGGVLYINPNINFGDKNINVYMKNILLHEITHILIFSPGIIGSLRLNNTINGVPHIISKNVVAKAKEHFGCNSMEGVPLENQGGSGTMGSHWESRYMLGDYMVSTDFPDSAISDITLALFEDSGFYKVNYYSGGLFKFGKNKGCSFFNQKCIVNEIATFDDFCDESNEPLCSSSKTIKSSCYLITYPSQVPTAYQYFSNTRRGGFTYADYCPIPYESRDNSDSFPKHCQFGSSSSNYGEKLGSNSFCFMSSIVQSSSNDINEVPVCYEIECDSSSQKIIVKIGDNRIECPSGGGSVSPSSSGLKGTIDCPAYSELCPSNNILCNDIYTCLTQYAKRDNYNYATSAYNYEGSTVRRDNDDDDGDIAPITYKDSSFLRTNFALFMAIFLLFIAN